jgi:hypothetical protein
MQQTRVGNYEASPIREGVEPHVLRTLDFESRALPFRHTATKTNRTVWGLGDVSFTPSANPPLIAFAYDVFFKQLGSREATPLGHRRSLPPYVGQNMSKSFPGPCPSQCRCPCERPS